MESISMTDMRRHGAKVISQLKAGTTVALTHNGVVLAHIVPIQHIDSTDEGLTSETTQQMALSAHTSYETLKALAAHAAQSAMLLNKLARQLRPPMDLDEEIPDPEGVHTVDTPEPERLEWIDSMTPVEPDNCEGPEYEDWAQAVKSGIPVEPQDPQIPQVVTLTMEDILAAAPEQPQDDGPGEVSEPVSLFDAQPHLVPLNDKQEKQLADFYGLVRLEDGITWSLTGAGMERALSACRSMAKKDPNSPEATALALDDDNQDKFAFLVSIQLAKRERALEKRAGGDRNWCPGVS